MAKFDTLILVSGGVESVTLAHEASISGRPYLMYFESGVRSDQNQKHVTKTIAFDLGAPLEIVEFKGLQGLLSGIMAPKFSSGDEWDTRCPIDASVLSVVISTAVYFAGSKGIKQLQVGLTSEQIRPHTLGFLTAIGKVIPSFDDVMHDVDVTAPYGTLTKAEVLKRGSVAGVDYANTWSCFEDGPDHCGTCPSCEARRKAFVAAGLSDPTVYISP